MVPSDERLPLRAIARIIDEWAYDIAQKWFDFFGGDARLEAICLFTQLANTEYILADPVLAARYRAQFVAPLDCRPVLVASIALALGIDAETTRRKLYRLKALGLCSVDDRGVIIQLDFLHDHGLRRDYENLAFRLGVLIGDLRALILDNGYDPASLAELAGHLDIDLARINASNNLVAIIIAKYLARTVQESSFIFGSDHDAAVIYFCLYVENKRLITRDPVLSKSWAWLDTPAPAAARQPVSSNHIARKLSMSPETVRRRVNRLIAMGLIERTGRGLLINSMPGVMEMHATREYHHLLNMLKSVKQIEMHGWLG